MKVRWLSVSEHHDHNKVDDAVNQLKQAEVRITPQRHAVLEFLVNAKSHPTADEIYKALEGKFPNMSVATVYNNLRVFREIGIVKELTYGDSSSRFDYTTTKHYHVICEPCGKIVDFHYPTLDEVESLAEQVTGFQITHHRMEIYGICPDCQKKD